MHACGSFGLETRDPQCIPPGLFSADSLELRFLLLASHRGAMVGL